MKTSPHVGWVYLMRNKSMPGIVKIGYTMDDPWERAYQLSSSTSVPTPFTLVFSLKTEKPWDVEEAIHIVLSLDGRRVTRNREFFYSAVVLDYNEQTNAKRMANEDQENEWLILRLRHAARIHVWWQRVLDRRIHLKMCDRITFRCREQMRMWFQQQEAA